MEFYEFANIVTPFVFGGMNKDDATRELFLSVIENSEEIRNYLLDIDSSTYRRYLRKDSSISHIASKIVGHFDMGMLAGLIDDLPHDSKLQLLEELSPHYPGMTLDNLPDSTPRLLAEIISSNAKKRRGGKKSKGTTSQTTAEEPLLLAEANGQCPLCGKALIRRRGSNTEKRYRLTFITSAKAAADYDLKRQYNEAVPQPPTTGTPGDMIVLCVDCSREYEKNPTPERYAYLIDIKKRLHEQEILNLKIYETELDRELPLLLSRLGDIQDYQGLQQLEYKALKIKDKVTDPLLIFKITNLTLQFYHFIEEQYAQLEATGDFDFDVLATQVRLCYKQMSKKRFKQEEIFDVISDWFKRESGCKSTVACETLTAFFVQNCEVFDAIAE